MAEVPVDDAVSKERQLNVPPPRPPGGGKKQSLMSMAAGPSGDPAGMGMMQSSPAVQVIQIMGSVRNDLMKLAALLPPLAMGVQQIIEGLESVVPQMAADMVAGNPPGSGGAMMGAAQANQSPSMPPTQGGMP